MLELILTACVFWIVWKVLDAIFRRKPKATPYRPGDYLKQLDDGQWYVVRDVTPEPDPEAEEQDPPANVVKFPKGGRQG